MNRKGANERFVRLSQGMMQSPAWRSLNGNARAVYIELASLYRGNNNGLIGFSARQASSAIPISISTAARSLALLEERGFIVAEAKGRFDRKRQVTRWRLTEFDCDVSGQPASRDFETWVLAGLPPTRPPGDGERKCVDG
ncbi:helix-turn-helix domain-containing protein [Bradyrhizobium sp. WYCCWR 13023]|uniref:Helix-turn-helix domain-containing protein n=1 Tax=Bradyrhizobium zhengyangense TaxID=2911009 RepID=A0A9X1RHK0_9BRAD|nr:helix-turn-helix domain-containing protein [Bradyrhizobium zhengyangense]MCG2632856.1 helix-turn-helix domain-containing protein [Bradyrhizobium zhengyangense]